jgi:hypothetical protein
MLTGAIKRLFVLVRPTISGVLTTAGTITRKIITSRAVRTGVATFAGETSYVVTDFPDIFARTVSGLISFAGRTIRRVPLSGWLIRTLNLSRAVSSGLAMAGTVINGAGSFHVRTITGAIFTAGQYAGSKLSKATKVSALPFMGAAKRIFSVSRTYAGIISNSGVVTWTGSLSTKTYTGAITFSSRLLKQLFKTYTGGISFAGAVSRSSVRAFYTTTGALSSAGAVVRASVLARTKSGALSFSNTLSGVLSSAAEFYWKGVGGVVSITGTATGSLNTIADTLSGSLEIYGRITIIDAILKRISAASITPAGSFVRSLITNRTTRVGSLSLSGIAIVLYGITRNLQNNAVSFAGDLTVAVSNLRFYTATGIVSFAGSVSSAYRLLRTYTGGVSFSGAVTDKAYELLRIYTGQVSFAGAVSSLFRDRDTRFGYLNFIGSVTRYFTIEHIVQESSLAFAGGISKAVMTTRSISGSMGLIKGLGKSRETLYMGPPNL